MTGTGYVYYWRHEQRKGRIRVCAGAYSGRNVDFEWDDCSAELRRTLGDRNIVRPRECPPPDGALCVRFGVDIRDGSLVAIEISEE
jgi:hypothetical protein